MLPHLFEPFAQSDRSLERTRGGLGLGLALVKGLTELHGGEVSAESPGIGRGTEVTLRFPISPETEEIADAPATPALRGPRRVLIIEDDRDTADSLRDLLELAGHTVHVAYSGPSGLGAARQLPPEVVLCDLGLPEMDGYAVAAALRADPATAAARLIAISGYGQHHDQRRAREVGFDRHLTKPVDFAELERLL